MKQFLILPYENHLGKKLIPHTNGFSRLPCSNTRGNENIKDIIAYLAQNVTSNHFFKILFESIRSLEGEYHKKGTWTN